MHLNRLRHGLQADASWVRLELCAAVCLPGKQGREYSAAGVTIAPNGIVYGTTMAGGASGDGTVYSLRPPAHASANALAGWTETVIYSFGGGEDGMYPMYGSLVFDPQGNLYGTTSEGGVQCSGSNTCGTMFELSPSGGSWTKSSSFNFTGNNDGAKSCKRTGPRPRGQSLTAQPPSTASMRWPIKSLIGPEVIDPQGLGRSLLGRRRLVEEEHVRFDALLVEDARRQPQQSVEIEIA